MAGEGLADVGNDPRRHDQHTMQKFRQVHLSRALAAGDRTATESVRPNARLGKMCRAEAVKAEGVLEPQRYVAVNLRPLDPPRPRVRHQADGTPCDLNSLLLNAVRLAQIGAPPRNAWGANTPSAARSPSPLGAPGSAAVKPGSSWAVAAAPAPAAAPAKPPSPVGARQQPPQDEASTSLWGGGGLGGGGIWGGASSVGTESSASAIQRPQPAAGGPLGGLGAIGGLGQPQQQQQQQQPPAPRPAPAADPNTNTAPPEYQSCGCSERLLTFSRGHLLKDDFLNGDLVKNS